MLCAKCGRGLRTNGMCICGWSKRFPPKPYYLYSLKEAENQIYKALTKKAQCEAIKHYNMRLKELKNNNKKKLLDE